MIEITKITELDDKRHIALLDTTSISFMQGLSVKGLQPEVILKDYDSVLIPEWVLTEINDAILCQLVRDGEINIDNLGDYRKDLRKITYSKEQDDHSIILVTELVDNELFVQLVLDKTVHIIFSMGKCL